MPQPAGCGALRQSSGRRGPCGFSPPGTVPPPRSGWSGMSGSSRSGAQMSADAWRRPNGTGGAVSGVGSWSLGWVRRKRRGMRGPQIKSGVGHSCCSSAGLLLWNKDHYARSRGIITRRRRPPSELSPGTARGASPTRPGLRFHNNGKKIGEQQHDKRPHPHPHPPAYRPSPPSLVVQMTLVIDVEKVRRTSTGHCCLWRQR